MTELSITKPQTITKEKIALMLKNKLGLSGIMCGELVDKVFTTIYQLSTEQEKITIQGFGCFFTHDKKERQGRNIHAQKSVKVSARTVFKFSPAKSLREKINDT